MEDTSSRTLLEALISEQNERNVNDIQFAALLGVPRSTWTLTRLGRKPIGLRVARAAWSKFPGLRPLMRAFFFPADVPVGTHAAEQGIGNVA